MLFVGRVHKIKNLLLLLEALQQVQGEVSLDIVGVKEDEAYWQECKDVIKKLPSTIAVNYLGEMPHHEVHKIVGKCHVFCLPTAGENFGHAIFEALAEGKPVIISDQTPWKNLVAARAGMDLPIDVNAFAKAIQTAVKWDEEEYQLWSNGAKNTAKKYITSSNLKEKYLGLFA
jgi:glycosyltransferase involved in cell wall biosynthesis